MVVGVAVGGAQYVATVSHSGSGCGCGRSKGSLCLALSSDKTLKVHLVEDKQVIRSAAISNLVHPSLNVILPPSPFLLFPLSLSLSPFLSSFPPSLSFPLPSLIYSLDKEVKVIAVSYYFFSAVVLFDSAA